MKLTVTRRIASALLALMLLTLTVLPQMRSVYASGLDVTGTGSGWLTVYPKNSQFDYVGDQQTGSGSVAQDIVGDANNPPFYVNYDSASGEMGFRIRVNNLDGTQKDKFTSFAFVGVDANQNGSIDFFMGVYNPTNNNGKLGIYNADPNKANTSPSTTGIINPALVAYTPAANQNYSLMPAPGSNFSGDADYFVTFKVKVADINTAMASKGITVTATTPLQYIIGTAAQDNSFNQDIAGIQGISTNDSTTWKNLGVFSPPVDVTGTILNQAPVAAADTLTVAGNGSGSVTVTANDTDAENGLVPSSVTIQTQPSHGTASVGANGLITYTPTIGYSGSDSFTYTVKDTNGAESNPATVTVTVTPPPVQNAAPVAAADTLTVAEGGSGTVTVTANDTDAENGLNPSTVTIKTPPFNGMATVGANGAVTYTPNPGFSGTDSFAYTVQDTNGAESNLATVTVTVTPAPVQNAAPVAAPDTLTVAQGGSGTVTVTANDTDAENGLDPTTVKIQTAPSHGTATASPNGQVAYTPDAGFYGTDSFTYTVKDLNGAESNEAAVTVTVTEANSIPVAHPRYVEVEEGAGPVRITLEGHDRETVTGLVYLITEQPSRGTLTLEGGSQYLYTPDSGFTSGSDSFRFVVTDTDGKTSPPAEVTIQMNKGLNGWVGGKAEGDPAIVKAVPGYPLKLSAVSSLLAREVQATIGGNTVSLTLANPLTYLQDGFKKWENAAYLLTSPLEAGSYTATFQAFNAEGAALPAEVSLADNRFEVLAYDLELQATPDRIVGDGRSTTELSAVLTDGAGHPVADTEVVFSVPSGLGTFVGPVRVPTDAQGRAATTYRSADLSSDEEKKVAVQAEALDLSKGLHAKDEFVVTFQPAVVSGVITRGPSNEKVAGATVRVTLDLDGDGVITPGVDFDRSVTTGPDGSYAVAVPRGSAVYTIEVTQNVMVGGVPTPVTYKQTAEVGSVSGAGQDNYESTKTAAGIILMKQPGGGTGAISASLVQKTRIYLKDAATGLYLTENGSPKAFPAQSSGVFSADGLAIGTYIMEIRYEVEPGQEIIVQKSEVNVTANGEMNISEELIDPYGAITDSVTGAPVPGATVTLYYANTPRNGGKADAEVFLPAIPGFAPNDNKSPAQSSDAQGLYAYMVYPYTDYYLVVTKPGYERYVSPTLSVETEIVRHDIALQPVVASPSPDPEPTATPVPTAAPTAAPASQEVVMKPEVAVSLDRNLIEESGTSTVFIDYKQTGNSTLVGGLLTVTLPEGVAIVDPGGGLAIGNTVTWPVNSLAPGESGRHQITVRWPQLGASEQTYEISASLTGGSQAQPVKATSSAALKVYSNRFGELKHQRYILGYPDGQFKTAKSLTRAELAAIVARLAGGEQPTGAASFKDVPKGHWAADYIGIAVKQGYFSGYADGTFRPEAPVTRGEIAAVMAKFLKLDAKPAVSPHFTDLAGHWAANAVEGLYSGKFVSGYPDATFRPDLKITRAEAVTMINRMLYRGPLTGLSPQFPDVPAGYWAFGDIQEATQSHESNRLIDGEVWVRTLSDEVN